MIVCPNCGIELQKVKKTVCGHLKWVVDHYEPVDTEIFYNCPNCGKYLDNESFE